MKKNIFLIALMLLGFSFLPAFSGTANAQSCCSSKGKAKASCEKKKATSPEAEKKADETEVKGTLVFDEATDHYKTEQFRVYGNCGMCEKTIEGSLKDVEGVSLADWNKETDQMTVTYDPELITLDQIKQKIANVGYDSDTHRAKDEVYESLPGCCQYERPSN